MQVRSEVSLSFVCLLTAVSARARSTAGAARRWHVALAVAGQLALAAGRAGTGRVGHRGLRGSRRVGVRFRRPGPLLLTRKSRLDLYDKVTVKSEHFQLFIFFRFRFCAPAHGRQLLNLLPSLNSYGTVFITLAVSRPDPVGKIHGIYSTLYLGSTCRVVCCTNYARTHKLVIQKLHFSYTSSYHLSTSLIIR